MPKKPTRQPFFSQAHESWAIPCTQGVIALVDADMAEAIGSHKWCAGLVGGTQWRAARFPKGGSVKMHREIMSPPDGMVVDHRVHHDPAERVIDNRRSNLRVCAQLDNSRNSRPREGGSSRYKGVGWRPARGKWQVRIYIDGKQRYLGLFADELTAAKAYNAAAIKHFGEFAFVNEV